MDKLDNLLSNTGDIALRRRAKLIIETLKPKEGEYILDLGCGDGFYLYLLSNLGLNSVLYGVDFDIHALNSAMKNLEIDKVKLIQADLMEKLPFNNNTFDAIVMSEVMEHLPDDIKCMKEVRRILKRNGRIVLSVPNINYPFFWDPINWILQRILRTHIKSGFWAGIWNQHLRLYSEENLKSVLKKSGFSMIIVKKLTHYCLPFNHYLINLGARLLTNKSIPLSFKRRTRKFDQSNKKRSFNPFWIIFKLDSLNDNWHGEGSAVSLVASAIK